MRCICSAPDVNEGAKVAIFFVRQFRPRWICTIWEGRNFAEDGRALRCVCVSDASIGCRLPVRNFRASSRPADLFFFFYFCPSFVFVGLGNHRCHLFAGKPNSFPSLLRLWPNRYIFVTSYRKLVDSLNWASGWQGARGERAGVRMNDWATKVGNSWHVQITEHLGGLKSFFPPIAPRRSVCRQRQQSERFCCRRAPHTAPPS